MSWWPTSLLQWFEIVAPTVALITVMFGIIQYFVAERSRRESRRIEATRPFLERQLKLYSETICTTAVIATSRDPASVEAATRRFWELFWGELALVEDQEVACAMEIFGNALSHGHDSRTLELLSLSIAHCFRKSLARSWGTPVWDSPHPTPSEVMAALDEPDDDKIRDEIQAADAD